MKKSGFLIILSCLIDVSAKCMLPSPDGGVPDVSNRNVAGVISNIFGGGVWIDDVDRGGLILVKLSGKIQIFTSFGGGGDPWGVLRVGQSARIWLRGCRFLRRQDNFAAYFEVFSYDPADAPPKDYFFIRGQ